MSLSQLTAPAIAELQEAGLVGRFCMKKNSRKTHLTRGLGLLAVVLTILNQLLDILSKVVNYDRPIWKHRISV